MSKLTINESDGEGVFVSGFDLKADESLVNELDNRISGEIMALKNDTSCEFEKTNNILNMMQATIHHSEIENQELKVKQKSLIQQGTLAYFYNKYLDKNGMAHNVRLATCPNEDFKILELSHIYVVKENEIYTCFEKTYRIYSDVQIKYFLEKGYEKDKVKKTSCKIKNKNITFAIGEKYLMKYIETQPKNVYSSKKVSFPFFEQEYKKFTDFLDYKSLMPVETN